MIGGLIAAAILSAAPVADGDWPTRSGFDINQLENSCAFEGFWPVDGRSAIQVTIYHDGERPLLLMSSPDWTSRPGQAFDLELVLNSRSYTAPAVGFPADFYRPGFSVGVGEDFIDDFAAARTLLVMRGETVVAHLNLVRTGLAMADLRACQRHVARRAAAQAAREARVDYIARDPFAEPGEPIVPRAPDGSVLPSAIADPTWASPPRPTYPDRARERGLSGSAMLTCTVQLNGSLTSCSVVNESPTGSGFGRAAMAATRSARLSPRSVDGVAPGGTVRFTVPFDLP